MDLRHRGSSWLRMGLFSLVVLVLANVCRSAPAGSSQQAMFYLSQYGYLGPNVRNINGSGNLIDEKTWNSAIADFQGFAGLAVTGELNDETIKKMGEPRCGVKDKVGFGNARSKRYALQGSRWKVKNLSYKIAKYPKNLDRGRVDKEIARAFAVWSDYTDLKFTPGSGQVHIEIRFEKGEHGDGDPFDGPGGTLAHAYFPVFGGDAHFDAAESWSIDSFKGTNLFQVAAHEFGHSLGLSHSDVRSALMAPFYRGFEPAFTLDGDDISGIQALYGRKSYGSGAGNGGGDVDGSKGGRRTTQAPPTGNEDPVLCNDPKFDTIFSSAEGETFIFKGNNYYKLTEETIAKGYPQTIGKGWPGLPGNIDAAFTYKNGKTYFFKGTQYWRYNGRKMDGQYPKEISEGFTGIPDNIDAAMVWSGNGKIYFYKGSKFWRFDPAQRPPVKTTYPKPIANWEGIPNNIGSAFQWTNGYTYFYKDDGYYRFNDRSFSVDAADPAFPRSTAAWWFGCSQAPRGTLGTRSTLINQLDTGSDSNVDDTILDAEVELHQNRGRRRLGH